MGGVVLWGVRLWGVLGYGGSCVMGGVRVGEC